MNVYEDIKTGLEQANEYERSKTVDFTIKEVRQMTNDIINHPAHYTDGKIECIDFIDDKGLNFERGNAIKYICRAGKKDKTKEIEDLQKAIWYLQHEIERLSKLEEISETVAGLQKLDSTMSTFKNIK